MDVGSITDVQLTSTEKYIIEDTAKNRVVQAFLDQIKDDPKKIQKIEFYASVLSLDNQTELVENLQNVSQISAFLKGYKNNDRHHDTIEKMAVHKLLKLDPKAESLFSHTLRWEDLHTLAKKNIVLRHVSSKEQAHNEAQAGEHIWGDALSISVGMGELIQRELNNPEFTKLFEGVDDFLTRMVDKFKNNFEELTAQLSFFQKQRIISLVEDKLKSNIEASIHMDRNTGSNETCYLVIGLPYHDVMEHGYFDFGKIGSGRIGTKGTRAAIDSTDAKMDMKEQVQYYLNNILEKVRDM
jgi:hypothetical protein